ncbi:MAG: phospholipid/cholesterol/gamma-HCH transport system permease protein [Phenylobacterium sp.]|jgi:phospholipid/cholesterol/gamma-HCH transport system permease protein
MTFNGFTPFVAAVIRDLCRFYRHRSINFDVLVRQILFTGVEAVGLAMLISLLLGALIIVEGYQLLTAVGQTDWIYKILIFALVRDLGPFIICFIVLARSGTAITTELGNMVVSKEVDALIVMGISPISYLVSPRVLAMILSLVVLMSYFLISGIFGGFLVSNLFQNIPFVDFFHRLIKELRLLDLAIMLFKVLFSGLFIGLISSYYGLTVQNAITEVPQRNIKAVGRGVVAVCLVNVLGSVLYFILRGNA